MRAANLSVLALVLFVPAAPAAQDVIFDRVFFRAKVVVYEFPDQEGRSEAIHYIESMRDRFKPKAEVLDAASVPVEKLKGGFVLYTTLSEKSKLVRLATRDLGWQISDRGFHWRDLVTRIDSLRWIFVGKNPYANGNCAIFAAGNNGAILDIHSRFHGPTSYNLYRNTFPLRSGTYDENFVSRPDRIPTAAALQDVDQFFSTLQRVHPRPFARLSPDAYPTLRRDTATNVKASADSEGQVTVERLASLLYYAGAQIRDGHTSVWWQALLDEQNTHGKRFPALRLRYDNGLFRVAAARDSSLSGMEVVAVNGTPVMQFLQPILERCSGETLGFRAARFVASEPFFYYLTGLFDRNPSYRLTLLTASGESREVPLETLDFSAYYDFRNQDGQPPFVPNREGTKVEFLDSGATAHLFYSSFHSSPQEKKKVDAIFQEVKTHGTRNLVIDIRGNGGGQSDMAEEIFRHLYDGRFRAISVVRAQVSWDILRDVPWWGRPLAFPLRGLTIPHKIGEHRFPKPASFFSGHTYLLTDNGSFSMAGEFAAMFRDYQAGTIIGYETGGLPDTFGGPHAFTLRHSRISCGVAWTEDRAPHPKPGDSDHGVIPDVPLNEDLLRDFARERDPVLAYTLQYIKSHQ